MKTFIVNSDVPQGQLDAARWLVGVPLVLRDSKIENVRLKTAYCCTPDRKIVAVFEGPDKETVSSAMTKIGIPFTAVMEATKVG